MSPSVYLSILIPVHNQASLLNRLIQSIVSSPEFDDRCEIVICDDGSRHPVSEQIQMGPRMSIMRHPVPMGAAAARNGAATRAKGEILLFLDADTELVRGSITHAIKRFKQETGLGALNGSAELDAANPQDGFTVQYRALLDYITTTLRAPMLCTFFTPRCSAIRRELFFKAGQFNTSFKGATVEEYEFGYRLSQLIPIELDRGMSISHNYVKFWKTNKNYCQRVRLWTQLFVMRRRFDNLGGCTANVGYGSVLALIWIPGLALPFPIGVYLFVLSFISLTYAYWDIFLNSLKLKGPTFFFKTVLATWWFCFPIVFGAGLGLLDHLRKPPSKKLSLNSQGKIL